MKSDEMRWICDECGEPIGDDEGYIEAYKKRPNGGPVGGYPSEPSPTAPLRMKPGELLTVTPKGLVNLSFEAKKTVGIQVVHGRCDSIEDSGYWIGVERADTAEEWIDWLVHASGKLWCGQVEFKELVRIWQSKRRAVARVAS